MILFTTWDSCRRSRHRTNAVPLREKTERAKTEGELLKITDVKRLRAAAVTRSCPSSGIHLQSLRRNSRNQASFCRFRNEESSFVSARHIGTSRQTTRTSSRGSAWRTASARSMTVASSNNTTEIPRWNRRSSDPSQESRPVSRRRPSLESVQLFLREQALHASAGAR